MSGPGGFVEAQGSTPRTKWTIAQILAAVPASRGPFTFPAPYNTKAWRITDAGDCAGGQDCIWYVGYSYWRNMNYHVNDTVIKIFLGTNSSAGGLGPQLFTINKVTDVVAKVGPIFPVGSPWRLWPGNNWYWNRVNQDWLYIGDRDAWYRYNVTNGTQQLWIDAVGMWGADRIVDQITTNWNDTQHAFSVIRKSTGAMLGGAYYNESTGMIRFYSEPTMNEAHIDQSGRWTFIVFNNGDNKVYDNLTGTQVFFQAEGLTALGHLDAGWEYFVGADNINGNPNSTVLWSANPMTYHGLMHKNYDWSQAAFNHLSVPESLNSNYPSQLVYGSNADTGPWQNEITVVRMNGGGQQLIVAPVMTDLNAIGGDPTPGGYAKYPKGNVDTTGEYFIWTTNLSGSRLDAFVVKVPTQLLLMPTTPGPPTGIKITMGG